MTSDDSASEGGDRPPEVPTSSPGPRPESGEPGSSGAAPAGEGEANADAGAGEVREGIGATRVSDSVEAVECEIRPSSENEGEAPPSPSSSGYAVEPGSSSGTTGGGVGEIEEDGFREVDDFGGSAECVPGKSHFDEIGGDRVKFIRAGQHQVVFLVKGPMYMVCISCTEEPYESLRGQLDLIYGQMLLILTKSVNRCFEKNPKFDMTPLLGGTEIVFSSLIRAFSWNPATFLHAYTCLPLAYPTRQAVGTVLKDVADSGALFAILMCKHKVISLVGAQKASLHPDDMLLLANFILSSESFKTSESFSPICLPRYNSMAFLYAYVHFFDVDTYLILLTTSSDSFYHLRDCRIRIENVLIKSNVLSEVQKSMIEGGLRVEDLPVDSSLCVASSSRYSQERIPSESPSRSGNLNCGIGGPAGLWHFIYRSIFLDQYVSSNFSSPLNNKRQHKRLHRAYQSLYSSMHGREHGPHKTQYRRDENYVLLCWVTQDFELYAAFDPLADKVMAIKTCNRICQWVRNMENEIFLLGASPFSW